MFVVNAMLTCKLCSVANLRNIGLIFHALKIYSLFIYVDSCRTECTANMEAGGTNQSGNNEALLSLESALLTACETLSGLASLAVDFQYDSQDLLFAKVYVIRHFAHSDLLNTNQPTNQLTTHTQQRTGA